MQMIDKDEFLELLGDATQDALLEDECEAETIKKCIRLVRDMKAVEVVRCKDCQYAKPYDRVDGLTGYYCQHQNSTFLYGTNWERIFEPVREADDFCSYGERKNDV